MPKNPKIVETTDQIIEKGWPAIEKFLRDYAPKRKSEVLIEAAKMCFDKGDKGTIADILESTGRIGVTLYGAGGGEWDGYQR